MGGPHVLSPIPNLEAGEGLLVRDDRLNKSIDEAWKVLPPLYGVNGDTNNFFDRATEVRHDFFNFYRVRADLGRLKLKPDGDDGDVPAGLQVLSVKTPGKLYQLVLILVCLRRISERETMVGHGEWIHTPREMFPKYREALASLTGPGIALADVTAVWETFLKNKHDLDLTGNGLNHPNDFGHRLYAQTILSLLVPKP